MKHASQLGLIIALAFFVGCASLETNAYKSIGVIAVAVDGAMNGWGEYVRSGRANPGDEATVRGLYERYQGAMKVAELGVSAYKTQTTKDLEMLKSALSVVSAAAQDLTEFIHSFVPSKKKGP